MSDDVIEPRLTRFIEEHVGSVAELDLLLFLREHSQTEWAAKEAAQALRGEADWTRRQLDDFCSRGFVMARPGAEVRYRYSPSSEVEQLVADLARLYRERPVRTLTLIYSRPRNQIHSFADAFRLKKEK